MLGITIKSLFVLSITALLLTACQEEEVVAPEASFTQLFFDGNINQTYQGLDMAVGANGYVMLSSTEASASSFPNIHILKANIDGSHAWSAHLPENFVNPVPDLIGLNGNLYFLCTDLSGNNTFLMQVDEGAQEVTQAQIFDDIAYPLAASNTPDGGLLVVGYEREGRNTTLTKIAPNLSVAWQEKFTVQEDMEEVLFKHLTGQGEQFPFFAGSTADGSTYFFNAFYNYTLSVVFVDGASGAQKGVLNGFRQGAGLSSFAHIVGNQFAFSRFVYGKSYLFPNEVIDIESTSNSDQYDGFEIFELQPNSTIRVINTTLNNFPVTLFAGNTKSNQLGLYAYFPDTGRLLGTQYMGFNDDLELASIILTADGGAAIFATTQMAGRFPRPILIKLTPETMNKLVGEVPSDQGG